MKYVLKYYESPIGKMELVGSCEGIISLNFVKDEPGQGLQHENILLYEDLQDEREEDKKTIEHMDKCTKQLDEYFSNGRKDFEIKTVLTGTVFQKKVWNALKKIPYGEAVSYSTIAKRINNEKAARAVGNANNKNPISIIIPCHRVIGHDKSLTGYGGGLWRKKWLLEHEGVYLGK